MADVVNVPSNGGDRSGSGALVAVAILIIVVVLLLIFGLPLLRGGGTDTLGYVARVNNLPT